MLGSEGGLFNPIGRASITVFSDAPATLPFADLALTVDASQATLSYTVPAMLETNPILESSQDLQVWETMSPTDTKTETLENGDERVSLTFPRTEEPTFFVRLRASE